MYGRSVVRQSMHINNGKMHYKDLKLRCMHKIKLHLNSTYSQALNQCLSEIDISNNNTNINAITFDVPRHPIGLSGLPDNPNLSLTPKWK